MPGDDTNKLGYNDTIDHHADYYHHTNNNNCHHDGDHCSTVPRPNPSTLGKPVCVTFDEPNLVSNQITVSEPDELTLCIALRGAEPRSDCESFWLSKCQPFFASDGRTNAEPVRRSIGRPIFISVRLSLGRPELRSIDGSYYVAIRGAF